MGDRCRVGLGLGGGLSGGAFLTYNKKDVYSLLMALFFGAAMLCYAIVVYLLLRSPGAREDASLGEIEVAGRRRAHEGLGQA